MVDDDANDNDDDSCLVLLCLEAAAADRHRDDSIRSDDAIVLGLYYVTISIALKDFFTELQFSMCFFDE